MITIMEEKNVFIVSKGTKEHLPAHHQKNNTLYQYDGEQRYHNMWILYISYLISL